MLVIVIVLLSVLIIVLNKNNKKENSQSTSNTDEKPDVIYSENLVIYDEDGNIVYDNSKNGASNIIKKDVTIQGVAELARDRYIYLFNGQHFGEFGFVMDEYISTNIDNKKQKCIDYITQEEYDTSYIEEGDILICLGDLYIKGHNGVENDFDTKDNPIIVLKSADFYKMKLEAINNERETEITVGQYFNNTDYIYIQYNITDKGYKLPFAIQAGIEENTEIIGKIEKGKKIEIEYKDVSFDRFVLKSIRVIN